jgi:hypothetical protein
LKKRLRKEGKIKEKVSEQFDKGCANDNFPKKVNNNNSSNKKNIDINGKSYDKLWEDEGPETEEYKKKTGYHSVFPEIVPEEIPLNVGKRISKNTIKSGTYLPLEEIDDDRTRVKRPANKLSFKQENKNSRRDEIIEFLKVDDEPSTMSWIERYEKEISLFLKQLLQFQV